MGLFSKLKKRVEGEIKYREKQIKKAADNYASTGGAVVEGTSGQMNAIQLMYNSVMAAKENVIKQGTENFLATPTGREVQAEATKQTIITYLKNPLVLVALLIGLVLFVRR